MSNKVFMVESRTIIRVFLASPGDLGEERQAAKDAVDEVNENYAKPCGFQIDLIGWEDTISAAGRPQAIINEELKQCELFVGMLWARWGTPPDNEGVYTSGFEEEFNLATQRRRDLTTPHMMMFFKAVDEPRLKDPGPELGKVLNFKNKLIEEKQIFFDNFGSLFEFSKKIRTSLANYITQKRRSELVQASNLEGEQGQSRTHENSQTDVPADVGSTRTDFLESYVSKLNGTEVEDSISAADNARLRLMAVSVGWIGNDEMVLGPHDANLIYAYRPADDFDFSELKGLADAGLESFQRQNKPLWFWLAKLTKLNPDWLLFATMYGQKARRKGAFEVARHIYDVFPHSDLFSREDVISKWLNDDDSDVKGYALQLLRYLGSEQDLIAISKQIESGTSSIARDALEASVAITLRANSVRAGELVITMPFDQMASDILFRATEKFNQLNEEQLRTGLDHRNAVIRECALKELNARSLAVVEDGRRFADDASAAVRRAALSIIERYDGEMPIDDVSKILIKHRSGGGGIFGIGSSQFDYAGVKLRDEYKAARFFSRPIAQLRLLLETSSVDADLAYFTVARRQFSASSNQLRTAFDDRFRDYFESDLERVEKLLGVSESTKSLFAKMRDNESISKRKLVRETMDILCQHNDAEDLERIRLAIDEEATEPRECDIDFLRKNGSWDDIARLAAIAEKWIGSGTGLLGIGGNSLMFPASSTIVKLAKGRLEDLLELKLATNLRTNILRRVSNSEFKELSDNRISELLQDTDEDFRKCIILKAIMSLTKNRLTYLLKCHIGQETYFYNVVHWLDLPKSFSIEFARKVASKALAS